MRVPAHIETLQPYIPGKPIEETQRELGLSEVIKLASNENPLGPSPKAVKAIAAAFSGFHLYPDGAGFALKQRLAQQLDARPEELVLGNGSNEVIELLVRAFVGNGDDAVICRGSFVAYKLALHGQGKQYIEVPMKESRYDLPAMAERVGPNTKLVFVANPDNPTGTWFGREAFEKFLKDVSAKNAETLVVVDEAYFEYVTEQDIPNSLTYRRGFKNLVTLRTFSKIYGLAGLRLGYGIMAPELAAYVNRARMAFNVSLPAQIGGLAALDDQEHVRKSRDANTIARAALIGDLTRLGLSVLPSQANFVLADFGRPAAPIYEAILRGGVIVRPVANYGLPNSLRITVGTEAENAKLIGVLKRVLA